LLDAIGILRALVEHSEVLTQDHKGRQLVVHLDAKRARGALRHRRDRGGCILVELVARDQQHSADDKAAGFNWHSRTTRPIVPSPIGWPCNAAATATRNGSRSTGQSAAAALVMMMNWSAVSGTEGMDDDLNPWEGEVVSCHSLRKR
jgi:hypothetical protein